jgi:hypothetical protein
MTLPTIQSKFYGQELHVGMVNPNFKMSTQKVNHLVYGKLHTKFEQLWYHKRMLKVHLKMTSQYGVQTYFTLRI